MLVLSRKWNEEIVIAGGIRVKILEINGNRVRLGVEAPDHVSVLREEVLARVECEPTLQRQTSMALV